MFDTINYKENSLEEIKKYELKRAKILLNQLKEEKTLCSYYGKLIVHEFEFKGDKEKVIMKLISWIRIIEKFGFVDSDRTELIERNKRLENFLQKEKENPYRNMCNEKAFGGYLLEAMKVVDKKIETQKEMHDKKECICFNNN